MSLSSGLKMLFIGDVHGKTQEYLQIAKEEPLTFQVGDFGFRRAWNNLNMYWLDPSNHLVGQGNHECHDVLSKDNFPNFTGRYGWLNTHEIFWIGGALSIDLVYRMGEWYDNRSKECTWFPQEQLSRREMQLCKEEWLRIKPNVVASHDCPDRIRSLMMGGNKGSGIMHRYGWGDWISPTGEFLDELFKLHRPKHWIFGHYHKSWNSRLQGTEFRCLAELETFRLDIK